MASLTALKLRIGSVKSTQKITKAMKMVAAAKLRRAQEAAEAGRPYAQRLETVVASLASKVSVGESSPKLLAGTGNDQVHLFVVATSDKGLAGAFNTNIARLARRRAEELVAQNFLAKDRVDEARATHDRDVQRVAELRAQLATALLGARADEIKAAEHNVEAAKAALAQAEWKLDQKSVKAAVAGMVQDTYFVHGEWVNANQPVVSLLPPQNIKARFFVPERELGAIRLGQKLALACDGCPASIPAVVSFISPQAEYTPPVIYSQQERAKLVFLVEARPAPEDAVKLHPGQPLEVRFQ